MSSAAELKWVDVIPIQKWISSIPFLKDLGPHTTGPLANTVIVVLFILGFSLIATRKIRKKKYSLVPDDKLSAQTFAELIIQAFSSMLEESIGHDWIKFLPLIGTLGVFILFSNLSGLIPGMVPPTDSLNTTAACGLIVFVATHIIGIKTHGFKYIKQFLGPVWWLIPLMLPLEIISHLARPLSLAMRLFGNIMGDHLVFGIVVSLVPFLVPIPVLMLGMFVAVVQTAVFLLLSTVYVAGALSEAH